jgi:hypothetical protein
MFYDSAPWWLPDQICQHLKWNPVASHPASPNGDDPRRGRRPPSEIPEHMAFVALLERIGA